MPAISETIPVPTRNDNPFEYEALARTMARLSHLGATDIELLTASGLNYVVRSRIDDIQYVTKVPRPDSVEPIDRWMYSQREAGILELLEDHLPSPIRIPFALSEGPYLPVNLIEYLPGTLLTVPEVQALSSEEKFQLGNKLGSFVAWMANAIPANHPIIREGRIASLNKAEILLTNWTPQNTLKLEDIGLPILADHLYELFWQYSTLRKHGYDSGTITGHEDLKPSNWVFDVTRHGTNIAGILDFELTMQSCPEHEFRNLRWLGQAVLDAALVAYEQETGDSVDSELVLMWERIQIGIAAANWAMRQFKGQVRSVVRQRLEFAWPDADWSEVTNAKL